jgi:hypothetical protein
MQFPRKEVTTDTDEVDYFDLVSLDTFIAGYASQVVEGRTLSNGERLNLQALASEVRSKLPSLGGEALGYFESLAQLAEATLAGASRIH